MESGKHPAPGTAMPGPEVGPAGNVMSVDVEEHFHVAAFDRHISRDDWQRMPSRVEANTRRILELFEGARVQATFFILGCVAERSPGLVREIATAGHEVASHGQAHVPAFRQTPEEFREDVRRSKAVLEDACGQQVLGYRAASFSIVKRNLWAFEELDRAGFRYSSSVNPVRHDIYGYPDAPRQPFRPAGTGLIECPVTTLELAGQRWPCGGGGYFRILPYTVFRWALRRVSAEGQACLFYLHPWEVDPAQPRVAGASWKSRFRHYTNLHRTEERLGRLLRDFSWGRFDRLLGMR